MSDNKINKTHMLSDLICAVVFYGVCFFIMYKTESINSVTKGVKTVSSDMLSIWATILGFLITAMSILLTVKNTKYIKALKQAGHFQTLLRVYTESCFMITILIFYILTWGIIHTVKDYFWQIVIFFNILCVIKIFSCLKIFLKRVDLANDNS